MGFYNLTKVVIIFTQIFEKLQSIAGLKNLFLDEIFALLKGIALEIDDDQCNVVPEEEQEEVKQVGVGLLFCQITNLEQQPETIKLARPSWLRRQKK